MLPDGLGQDAAGLRRERIGAAKEARRWPTDAPSTELGLIDRDR